MRIEPQVIINGISVPTFLYGTAWKELRTQPCVNDALIAGFRGIDTANQRKHYYEEGVGAALQEAYRTGVVTRQELFLQTKFTHLAGQDRRLPYDPKADLHTQVMQSFASSLTHLHTEYLDSYVLHGPSIRSGLADEDWAIWRAMEELHRLGKVRLLGVSNVGLDQVQALCKNGTVKPSFVQNRCYASKGWDRSVREFCHQNAIGYQGFSLLTANRAIFQQARFREMVTRYGCTPSQLIFAFAFHAKMLPLTGTTDPAHMKEDLLAYDVRLTAEDVRVLESMAIN